MSQKPSELHHYTDLSGFIGIVNGGCFWASNALFLNDSKELEHALDSTEKAVNLLGSHDKSYARAEVKKVIQQMKAGNIPDTYVVCLSSQGDSLGQWRGYGGRIQGVRLSFNVKKLKKYLLSVSKTIALEEILYTKVSTARKIKDHLQSDDDLWDLLDDPDGDEESVEIEIHKRISALLPIFKHISFSAEREWRIIARPPRSRVKFRAAGNKIIPYFEVGRISHQSGDLRLVECISEVMIGPGFDQKLTAKSVKAFLEHADLGDVEVRFSEVPYRPSL